MIINIPKADLQRNINLEPNWYGAIFEKMETKPSADKQSTNYIPTFRIEEDGRTMEGMFNSKALAMMQPFIEALRGQKVAVKDKIVQEDISFSPEEYYGTKLKVKVDNDPWDGRLVSKIKGFLPYQADANVPFGN